MVVVGHPEGWCWNFKAFPAHHSTFIYTACYVSACQVGLPTADPIFLILSAKDHLGGTYTLSSSKLPEAAQEQEGTVCQGHQSLLRTPLLCSCVPVQPHNRRLTFLLLRIILFSSFLVSGQQNQMKFKKWNFRPETSLKTASLYN